MGRLIRGVALFFLVSGAALGLYVITLKLNEEISFFVLKATFTYVLFALLFLFWFITKEYKKLFVAANRISRKYDELETLLLDLRDGTKNFFKEKRRTHRVNVDMNARITNRGPAELVKVLNLSYEGALLRNGAHFKPGEVMDLNMYLPLFPQPLDVKAKVVRVSVANPKSYPPIFYTGIEYVGMDNIDKKKIGETIDVLSKDSSVNSTFE